MFIVGYAPYESRIVSANLNEIEILTDTESRQLHSIIASDVISQLDSLIESFTGHYRFSGNILVAFGGEAIYSKSVGYADPIKREPLKSESVFQLASVSKQFTAAATMLLAQDGLIDFSDPLSKYIPELPYKDITISHLLHHISGLPNYMYLIDKYWKDKSAPDNEDVIDLMAKYRIPLFFKPGSRYDYSNTGYVMLATVVQRVSGMSLNTFLQKRVFGPLEMKNTFVYSSADTSITRSQIDGFRAYRSGYSRIIDSHHDGSVGDKGICSTTEDLYKWDRALYNGNIISQEMLEKAFNPATTTGGKEVMYGFGFRIKESNGSKVIYHNGIWEGSRTNFHRFIDKQNTIIILNNTSISSNHELVRLIENTLNQDSSLLITSRITKLLVEKGQKPALEYYNEIQETQPFNRPDIRKLMLAAEFMHSIGKENKAAEIEELCKAMVAI